jgi:hypothetical protein
MAADRLVITAGTWANRLPGPDVDPGTIDRDSYPEDAPPD